MSETTSSALDSAIQAMGSTCYDVTIICTTDEYQASYWMDILENGMLQGKKVLAVSEDWNDNGGAGNGLGTLYAWKKACALAKTKYDQYDLEEELNSQAISAALYHTAGKGTRLAPLPASENNNKPGVKLPFPFKCSDGSIRPLSVLESVVHQTGIYARKGRLSVFWGDQVFIPTVASYDQTPTHHIDILCTLLGDTAPDAAEWKKQGLEKYGVIVVLQNGEAAQVEKVSHETAMMMLSDLGTSIQQVGPSLGSFSVSAIFLKTLMATFSMDLVEKSTKLDTDPHFWMPLTLPERSYISLMLQKGMTETESKRQYQRMNTMKATFLEQNSSLGLFGAVNVGKGACWWDYGQLKLYSSNCRLILENDNESANLLRRYLGIENDNNIIDSNVSESAKVDNRSYIVSSAIGADSVIQKSLLSNVAAQSIVADGAIIINCAAKRITVGKGAILYNIIADSEHEEIIVADNDVVVGVYNDDNSNYRLRSNMNTDGGQAWKVVLENNQYSFEQVHAKNFNSNIVEIAKQRNKLHCDMKVKLGL